MKATALLSVVLVASGVAAGESSFRKIVLDKTFRSEGVATGDVNHDGKLDVLAGEVWYAAPKWAMQPLKKPGTYNGAKGYSKCFQNFAQDANGDGWIDSIVVTFPGAKVCWYENPQNKPGLWKEHVIGPSLCGETPLFADLLGDGKPVLVTRGWWEAPADRSKSPWPFHPAKLGPACADMIVHDIDGDGDNDVITSSAHGYGIWWFEHIPTAKGITFKQHEIYKKYSQSHALILADLNGDGVQDLVTGKRHFAHQGHDPGGKDPAMLYWLEVRRPAKGKVAFTPHIVDDDSGVGTQFEVRDMNGDGKLDIITSNKKGVYVFLQK